VSFSGKNLLSRSEALERLLSQWRPTLPQETVPLAAACGRVLAEHTCSRNTLPICRSAQADGIAVRFADFSQGRPNTFQWQLGRDYAMADTGDDFPDQFDTVIRIEDLDFSYGETFFIKREARIKEGQLISPRGARLEEGEPLLPAGTRLNAVQLNLLAAGGYTEVPVLRRPVVAFIPTGSELIQPGQVPERGQNIDSNSVMIGALLESWGAEALLFPIVKDIQAELRAVIKQALGQTDIVLVNGGSAKGSEDYNEQIVKEYAGWVQHGIASIPGIPVLLALAGGKPLLNLPGPPFAAFSVMDWCVRRLVYAACGQQPPAAALIRARLTEEVKKPPGLEFYLRLYIHEQDGAWLAEPLTMRTRAARAMGLCNALIIGAADSLGWPAGAEIEATLI